MSFLRPLVLLAFLLLPAGSSFAQTHFLFEDPEPFKNPVQLPTGAVELLRREMQAASYCPNQTVVPAQSLRASRIDLGRDRLAFIVRSLDDCFNGPEHDRFWIVLHLARGYELLLQGGTVAVTVRRELTHGFPDIETNEDSAEAFYREVYKFNGSVYNASLCTRATLSTPGSAPSKPERVTCRTH
jgi:hypothetical protein